MTLPVCDMDFEADEIMYSEPGTGSSILRYYVKPFSP